MYRPDKFLMATTFSKSLIPLLHFSVNVQNKALKVENGAIMPRFLPAAAAAEMD